MEKKKKKEEKDTGYHDVDVGTLSKCVAVLLQDIDGTVNKSS